MDATHTATLASPPAASSVRGAAGTPRHVASAITRAPGDSLDPRIAVFQSLAAIPVRRPSVAGAAAKTDSLHVGGGARASTGGARVVMASPADPGGASVSLADGTSITFGSVRGLPHLEMA